MLCSAYQQPTNQRLEYGTVRIVFAKELWNEMFFFSLEMIRDLRNTSIFDEPFSNSVPEISQNVILIHSLKSSSVLDFYATF